MLYGTIAAYNVSTLTASHWAGSVDTVFGHTVYIGLTAIILNLAVSVILTLVLRTARVPAGTDETLPQQYSGPLVAELVEQTAQQRCRRGEVVGDRPGRRAADARHVEPDDSAPRIERIDERLEQFQVSLRCRCTGAAAAGPGVPSRTATRMAPPAAGREAPHPFGRPGPQQPAMRADRGKPGSLAGSFPAGRGK